MKVGFIGAGIHRQDRQFAMALRLGSHVLAGVWIAGTLRSLPPLARGAADAHAGGALCAGTADPEFLRPYLLFAAGPLMILWLVSVGILMAATRRNGHGRSKESWLMKIPGMT